MLQAPVAARDSGPFYWPPWKSRNVVLLGKSLANQCLQRAPKKLLVALGPGAHDVDQQVSPGHGGDKAWVAGACGNAPRQVAASKWEGQRPWNQGGPGCVDLHEVVRDSQIRILVWGLIKEGKKGLEPSSVGACNRWQSLPSRPRQRSLGKRNMLQQALLPSAFCARLDQKET